MPILARACDAIPCRMPSFSGDRLRVGHYKGRARASASRRWRSVATTTPRSPIASLRATSLDQANLPLDFSSSEGKELSHCLLVVALARPGRAAP